MEDFWKLTLNCENCQDILNVCSVCEKGFNQTDEVYCEEENENQHLHKDCYFEKEKQTRQEFIQYIQDNKKREMN